MIPEEILKRLHFDKRCETPLVAKVTRIDSEPKPCESCGKLVENRIVESGFYPSPKPHWRSKCKICSLWRNPDTGEFTITAQKIHTFFAQKYRNR